jgi:diguanylate cyclase (GGDEF)-like protein/PAS domain S-box-containing protein
MNVIDVRTSLLLQILNSALCCLILFFVWFENRKKFRGMGLWLLLFLLEFFGLLLIMHREYLGPFLSVFAANLLIMGGFAFLYYGIARFVDARAILWLPIAHGVVFCAVVLWATFAKPDIAIRNVNISAGIALYCLLIAALGMGGGSDGNILFRRIARDLSVEALFCAAVNIARLAWNVIHPAKTPFFNFDLVNTAALIAFNGLQIMLAFTLIMMVVRRLILEQERAFAERQSVIDELARSREKFAIAFETSPNAIILSRLPDGKIIDVNRAFVRKTGFSREAALAGSTVSLGLWVHDYDRAGIIATLSRGESVDSREYSFRTVDGRALVGLFSAQTIRVGDETCILSTIQDITDRKLIEESLRRNQQFLSGLVEYSEALICVKYLDGEYKLVNSKWEKVTGISRADALGKTDIELFRGELGMRLRERDIEVIARDGVRETEEPFETPSGSFVFLSVKFPLHGDDGKIESICNIMTDITERKHDEEVIKHMATHDLLTDLPSLALARDRLAMSMAYVRRNGTITGVMFIDLDGFKGVNDTFGHDVGDLVLREVARLLLSCIRETDTASRIGGDEFLLILTTLASADDASAVAEKLLALISAPVIVDGRTVSIGASIGIALYPSDGADEDALVKAADEAMYRVKKSGKNSFSFASQNAESEAGSTNGR